MGAETYEDVQTVTVDQTAIVFPEPNHADEDVWIIVFNADVADDVYLVKDAADAKGIPTQPFSGITREGPWRLRSDSKPAYVRLGTNTTVDIIVVRDG